jgi:predicted RNA-binding protein with TRAM domain
MFYQYTLLDQGIVLSIGDGIAKVRGIFFVVIVQSTNFMEF